MVSDLAHRPWRLKECAAELKRARRRNRIYWTGHDGPNPVVYSATTSCA